MNNQTGVLWIRFVLWTHGCEHWPLLLFHDEGQDRTLYHGKNSCNRAMLRAAEPSELWRGYCVAPVPLIVYLQVATPLLQKQMVETCQVESWRIFETQSCFGVTRNLGSEFEPKAKSKTTPRINNDKPWSRPRGNSFTQGGLVHSLGKRSSGSKVWLTTNTSAFHHRYLLKHSLKSNCLGPRAFLHCDGSSRQLYNPLIQIIVPVTVNTPRRNRNL
mmetsp:Transcript_731/g.2186  ORF Transcript_731/g.2186 Transcript_731/m.2186 type:complete len:216 (+) Transcript_731:3951-4598(+)